jgi:hypothetical protein
MNRHYLLVPCFVLVIVSCGSNHAFDYSEKIVRMESELSAEIAIADKKVSRYLEARKKDSAILVTGQMELMAERKLDEVRELSVPAVREGENFKTAAVGYFSYIKSIYSSFNRYTRAASDREKEAEANRLVRILAEKKSITLAMQEAQKKFAAANDFRVDVQARP